MTARDIFGIIAVIAEIFVLLVLLYYRARGNVAEMIAGFIAAAEGSGKPGPEKMDMVVEWLYGCTPGIFRGLLTRDRLREMAQVIFDWMKTYALEYLESKAGKDHPPDEQVGGQDVGISENNKWTGEEDGGMPGEEMTEEEPEEDPEEEPEEDPEDGAQDEEAAEGGEQEDGIFAEECGVVPEIVEGGE